MRVASMYTHTSRAFRTNLLTFHRYEVHGIQLLGKNKEGNIKIGNTDHVLVSKVVGKGDPPTPEVFEAVGKRLKELKPQIQSKMRPWLYVFYVYFCIFGAN
jgi:hypothetical protein